MLRKHQTTVPQKFKGTHARKLLVTSRIITAAMILTLAACSSSHDEPAIPANDPVPTTNPDNGTTAGTTTAGTTTAGTTTAGTTTAGTTTAGTTTAGTTTAGTTTAGTTTAGTTTAGTTTAGTTTAGTTTAGTTTAGTTTAGTTTAGDTTAGTTTAGDTTAGTTTAGDTTAGETTAGETTAGDTTAGTTTDGGGEPVDFFNAKLEVGPDTPPADGTPSIPANFRIDLLGNDWAELNWAPSADDGDVVEYRIYRNDGATYSIRGDQTDDASGTQLEIEKYWKTTSFIDCNFTRFLDQVHKCGENQPQPGAEYAYRISAIDNDGRESAQSEPLRVKFYEKQGSPVEPYKDAYLDGDDRFPFDTDFSTTDNFLDRFKLVFSDEFNGETLDSSKWNTALTWNQNDNIINGEKQYFVDTQTTPDFGYNPFVMTGTALSIQAIQTPPELSAAASGQPFLSGALSSHDKFGFTYGYAEGRMKVGGVSGQLSSFYLFRRWAGEQSPEIDIVEYLGENPFGDEDAFQTYHFRDTVHGVTRSSPTMFNKSDQGLYSDDYHTFGVLWEPGLVVWYIDGQEIKRLSGPQIGRQSMNIVTYQVTGSDWAPFPDTSPENYPLKFDIDYIRVYQRDPYLPSQP